MKNIVSQMKTTLEKFNSRLFHQASQVAKWYRICLPMQEVQEMWVQSLGWEHPLEEEMATHSGILA